MGHFGSLETVVNVSVVGPPPLGLLHQSSDYDSFEPRVVLDLPDRLHCIFVVFDCVLLSSRYLLFASSLLFVLDDEAASVVLTYMHACMHTCIHTYMHIPTYRRRCVRVCLGRLSACLRASVPMYLHAYIHTLIQTHAVYKHA